MRKLCKLNRHFFISERFKLKSKLRRCSSWPTTIEHDFFFIISWKFIVFEIMQNQANLSQKKAVIRLFCFSIILSTAVYYKIDITQDAMIELLSIFDLKSYWTIFYDIPNDGFAAHVTVNVIQFIKKIYSFPSSKDTE